MVRVIAILLALAFTRTALADEWNEYDNPEYSFSIHFPTMPAVKSLVYQRADGRSFPARVFSAAQETGVFTVTVIEMPGEESGADASVVKDAALTIAQGDTIKFDIPHRIRSVYGRQLGLAGASGGYSYVALFYRNNRLYEVEGKAFSAGGQAEADAMRFQQSLDLT